MGDCALPIAFSWALRLTTITSSPTCSGVWDQYWRFNLGNFARCLETFSKIDLSLTANNQYLSRRWSAPKSPQDNLQRSTLYPNDSKSTFALSMAFNVTFSPNTMGAFDSCTNLNISPQRFFSAIFLPCAAWLNAWQGKPPQRMSNCSLKGVPDSFVKSP